MKKVHIQARTDEGYTFLDALTWTDGRVFAIEDSHYAGNVEVCGVAYRKYAITVKKQQRYAYQSVGGEWFMPEKA